MFSLLKGSRTPNNTSYSEEGKNAKHLPLNWYCSRHTLRTVDRFTCAAFNETVAHLFCKIILKFSDLKRTEREKTQSNENRIRKLNVHGAMSISRIFSTVFLSVSR